MSDKASSLIVLAAETYSASGDQGNTERRTTLLKNKARRILMDKALISVREMEKELERLRTENEGLKQSLGLPDEITVQAVDDYEGLRVQFNALKTLANCKCKMASHWSKMVDKLTREAALSSDDMLNSERDTNAALTDLLLQAETEIAELKQERDKMESALKKMISMYIVDDYISGEDRINEINKRFDRIIREA